jgi:hypothetical protein
METHNTIHRINELPFEAAPESNPKRYSTNTKAPSIPSIVRNRLSSIDLQNIPQPAVVLLSKKLTALVEAQAIRAITPRSVALAVYTAASSSKIANITAKEVAPKPQA